MSPVAKRIKNRQFKRLQQRALKILDEREIFDVIGRVNCSRLNVRKKPDLNSKIIGRISRGNLVRILNKEGDWYQIVLDGKHAAYIYKRYIDIVREEKNGIITANILNVRKEPNTEAEILGTLKKGAVVNILKGLPQWLKINFNETEAYVYRQYIEMRDVPLIVDPTENTTTFFYQRKDLQSVQLESFKKIEIPSGYNEAIAAKALNNYGNLMEKISDELQIDIKTALSVLCVESHGKGFIDNKMIIRFENHVFDMFWGKNNSKKFWEHFKYDKLSRRNGHYFRESIHDKWEVCHTSQKMEWKVLQFAMKLDQTAALKSISMGAPQIMGFNYKFVGYNSPQHLFEQFQKDIRFQIFALFDFCKYKPERIRYLQKRDFYSFSKEYNGPANPAAYEERLLKFYNVYRDLLS